MNQRVCVSPSVLNLLPRGAAAFLAVIALFGAQHHADTSAHAYVPASPPGQGTGAEAPTPASAVDGADPTTERQPETGPEWQALPTDGGTVLYTEGHGASARRVVALWPRLRANAASAFGVDEPADVVLRIYPSLDDLVGIDPLVQALGRGFLRTYRAPRELDIVLAWGESSDELASALMHELVHRLVADSSDDRLPSILAEGIAAFSHRPYEGQAREIAQLRNALESGDIPAWTRLMAPGGAFMEAERSVVLGRSIAQFLVDTHGFEILPALARESSNAPGWRVALEGVQSESAEQLEQLWRAWLPSYLDGGWQSHPLFPSDLGRWERLVAGGAYGQAERELAGLIAFNPDGALGEDATVLLEQARAGRRASRLLEQSREALEHGESERAAIAAEDARRAAEEAGAVVAQREAVQLRDDARRASAAGAQMNRLRALPPWRVFARRRGARQAGVEFASLGYAIAQGEARDVQREADAILALVGVVPLMAGIVLADRNRKRRRREYD